MPVVPPLHQQHVSKHKSFISSACHSVSSAIRQNRHMSTSYLESDFHSFVSHWTACPPLLQQRYVSKHQSAGIMPIQRWSIQCMDHNRIKSWIWFIVPSIKMMKEHWSWILPEFSTSITFFNTTPSRTIHSANCDLLQVDLVEFRNKRPKISNLTFAFYSMKYIELSPRCVSLWRSHRQHYTATIEDGYCRLDALQTAIRTVAVNFSNMWNDSSIFNKSLDSLI